MSGARVFKESVMGADSAVAIRLPVRATKLQRVLVAAAALLLPVILAGLVAWNGGVADPAKFAYGLGRLVVPYSVIVLIAWVVHLVSRRRSLWPGVVTLVILMTLFSASVGMGMFRGFQKAAAARERSAQSAQWDTASSQIEGISQSMREFLRNEDAINDPQVWIKAGNESVDKVDQLSAGLKGDAAIAAKATVSVSRELSALQQDYLKQVNLYGADGGLDVSTLKTREAIASRRVLLRVAIERHKRVVDSLTTQDQALFKRCVEMGMSEKVAANVRRGASSAMARNPSVRIQNLEAEALTLQDKYLETLEQRWGLWSVSGESIQFDESVSDQEVDVFNKSLERMAAIDEEQQALQKALLEAPPKKDK